MDKEILFEVVTPLNIRVRTTKEYWDYIVNIKHQPMKNKEDIVKDTFRLLEIWIWPFLENRKIFNNNRYLIAFWRLTYLFVPHSISFYNFSLQINQLRRTISSIQMKLMLKGVKSYVSRTAFGQIFQMSDFIKS